MPTLKQINDYKVTKIQSGGKHKLPALGEELFREPYGNIVLLAKKKSGKTTLIGNILQKCADKETTIYIFSSTINRDKTWKTICDRLEKKGITVEKFSSMVDENKQNHLKEIIEQLQDEPEETESDDELTDDDSDFSEEEFEWMKFQCPERIPKKKRTKKKKPKKKYIAPERIFIFDDLADELRKPIVATVLKKNRHFKCKTIISTHVITDIMPGSRTQIDTWILLGGLPPDKLAIVHKDSMTRVTIEQFEKLYNQATSQKYHFLYLDTSGDEYRLNFNQRFELVD